MSTLRSFHVFFLSFLFVGLTTNPQTYLAAIHTQACSCLHATFVGDNDRERESLPSLLAGSSAWVFLQNAASANPEWQNPFYRLNSASLVPASTPADVKLWPVFFEAAIQVRGVDFSFSAVLRVFNQIST